MAHDPLRPLTTDALGPNKMPAVTLLMARAPLWTNTEGPLTASQVISSPGSPLTRDNLVSKPRGRRHTKDAFSFESAKWLLLPSAVVGAGVFHIVPDSRRYIHLIFYVPFCQDCISCSDKE